MSVARRPLLTATAAGTLLCALWFVPSANATDEHHPTTATPRSAYRTGPAQDEAPLALADTGGADTSPYLVGGTLFLGLGAGFVMYSVRRSKPC
ncbi:LPXTG cell wall anchor domain-containing protein [Streptomyces sp. NBC_00083]|uniref:LPXTG cell wall anchor domain-containing protein n=1 Tax=Streptomyces sp. NBC_00083 TaxID=2975647 RepID=UPI00224DB282|nr:LPXTG cell wall anchor domain-containing protein [Streptomyces sp. NBC_00083]MCX5385264.1 LPXTG cell wall anchor domain-containing protein [Streptomyces sp. NBC_00083]